MPRKGGFPMKADGQTPDWSAAFYDDPEHAIGVNNSGLKKEIKEEIRQEYLREEWWKLFFSTNGDLKLDESLVKATLDKNIDELGGMAVPDAVERLSELSREAIAADQQRRSAQRQYSVMRGGPGLGPGEVPMAPANQGTLSSMIKQRQRVRSEANQSGGRESYGRVKPGAE